VSVPVERDTVLRIAALARLALNDAEADRLARELAGIIAHVDALAELDLAGVPEWSTAVEHGSADRADAAGADPLHAAPAAFAPGFDAPFFTVPRLAALDPDAQPDGDAGA
jgi:aspartyl-tRNA(Asn)/glutamyl-tRNA(Gln) amidotransferase subunit C